MIGVMGGVLICFWIHLKESFGDCLAKERLKSLRFKDSEERGDLETLRRGVEGNSKDEDKSLALAALCLTSDETSLSLGKSFVL